jgi:hypothetical protein
MSLPQLVYYDSTSHYPSLTHGISLHLLLTSQNTLTHLSTMRLGIGCSSSTSITHSHTFDG